MGSPFDAEHQPNPKLSLSLDDLAPHQGSSRSLAMAPQAGSAFPAPFTYPPDHSPALFGAVESSRWTATQMPSFAPAAFSLPHSPSSPSLLPSTNTSPVVASQLVASPTLTVGEVLGAFPSAADDPLPPPTGTLAARRGSGGGFETDSVVEGPIGLTPRVKPFIAKLNHLLGHPEIYQDCIVWDSAGEAFIVNANKRFCDEVLPRLFGHGNLASFTRQLNVYGFRRLSNSELMSRIDVKSQEGYSGWSHALFSRDDKSSLHLLNPRPSRARMLKKAEKQKRLEHEQHEKERKAKQVAAAAASAAAHAVGSSSFPTLTAPPLGHALMHDYTLRRESNSSNSSTGSASTASSLDSPTTPETTHLGLLWQGQPHRMPPITSGMAGW
ncbi:heat shock transcription factor [Rhodotorula toruloides]|uniref:Heat shock transcription factor n=1 Tax=Rhodotorula toruloides TaxID=5286 RepID=A0A511K7Z8_RHOTO|nr:heat shock transcription factor [Rhodotorula toruloides]